MIKLNRKKLPVTNTYKQSDLDQDKISPSKKRRRTTIFIMLYGPPAVGKETVAKELQKLTGYHLLLNHRFADLVGPIFGFGTTNALRINAQIRGVVYRAIVKSKIPGAISTGSYYSSVQENRQIKRWIKLIERYNGKMCFVRLFCDQKTLMKRVCSHSRAISCKVRSRKKLKQILRHRNTSSLIPSEIATSLNIDNTRLDPKETAEMIRKYYKL